MVQPLVRENPATRQTTQSSVGMLLRCSCVTEPRSGILCRAQKNYLGSGYGRRLSDLRTIDSFCDVPSSKLVIFLLHMVLCTGPVRDRDLKSFSRGCIHVYTVLLLIYVKYIACGVKCTSGFDPSTVHPLSLGRIFRTFRCLGRFCLREEIGSVHIRN